jgi:hypothetical protein
MDSFDGLLRSMGGERKFQKKRSKIVGKVQARAVQHPDVFRSTGILGKTRQVPCSQRFVNDSRSSMD